MYMYCLFIQYYVLNKVCFFNILFKLGPITFNFTDYNNILKFVTEPKVFYFMKAKLFTLSIKQFAYSKNILLSASLSFSTLF